VQKQQLAIVMSVATTVFLVLLPLFGDYNDSREVTKQFEQKTMFFIFLQILLEIIHLNRKEQIEKSTTLLLK